MHIDFVMCKRGDPLGFFDIHCVAKYRKKFQKKSHSAEKSGPKVGSLVCFRGSGRVLFFLLVLDALLRFECFEPP